MFLVIAVAVLQVCSGLLVCISSGANEKSAQPAHVVVAPKEAGGGEVKQEVRPVPYDALEGLAEREPWLNERPRHERTDRTDEGGICISITHARFRLMPDVRIEGVKVRRQRDAVSAPWFTLSRDKAEARLCLEPGYLWQGVPEVAFSQWVDDAAAFFNRYESDIAYFGYALDVTPADLASAPRNGPEARLLYRSLMTVKRKYKDAVWVEGPNAMVLVYHLGHTSNLRRYSLKIFAADGQLRADAFIVPVSDDTDPDDYTRLALALVHRIAATAEFDPPTAEDVAAEKELIDRAIGPRT